MDAVGATDGDQLRASSRRSLGVGHRQRIGDTASHHFPARGARRTARRSRDGPRAGGRVHHGPGGVAGSNPHASQAKRARGRDDDWHVLVLEDRHGDRRVPLHGGERGATVEVRQDPGIGLVLDRRITERPPLSHAYSRTPTMAFDSHIAVRERSPRARAGLDRCKGRGARYRDAAEDGQSDGDPERDA